MNCSKCNAEIPDDAKFCTGCGASLQQASEAPQASPEPHPEGAVKYAGFWKRAGAFIIDILFIFISVIVLTIIVKFVLAVLIQITEPLTDFWSQPSGKSTAIVFWLLKQIIPLTIFWLYFAIQESSKGQATMGKNIMKIYVTDEHYNRISFARASGRFWLKEIPFLFPLHILGFFLTPSLITISEILISLVWFGMAGYTQKKQAAHDFMAKTLVLRRPLLS